MAKRNKRWRQKPKVGASPGTLVAPPDAAQPEIRVIAYDESELLDEKLESVDEIPQIVEKYKVTWINIDGLGDLKILEEISGIAGIHKLALEDILDGNHRAKVEDFEDYLFIIIRMVAHQEILDTEQLSLYLGPKLIITFHEHPGDCLEPVRSRLIKASGMIRKHGTDYLAYAIIDAIIDGYLPVLEEYGNRLEEIEDIIISNPTQDLVSEIHQIKGDLLQLRHASWPLREIVNTLIRDQDSFISNYTQVYLRDCYDHSIHVLDLIENYREICSDLMNAYLSSLSNKMNEIMKVLTIIATLFIPLSFITGLYGMNFNPKVSQFNMPELAWRFGYPFALGIMLAITLTMLWYFYSRGWIGGYKKSIKK